MMDRFPGARNKDPSEQWIKDQSKGLWPCLKSLSLPRAKYLFESVQQQELIS